MIPEQLKTYIVSLKGGSGCLFQPINGTNEYTYILTAKHLFEGTRLNNDGQPEAYDTDEGQVISITRLVYQGGNWSEVAFNFVFRRGESYFPSADTDAAILKVGFIPGFHDIFQSNITLSTFGYGLNGYPEILNVRPVGERSTTHAISRLIAAGAHTHGAQLENVTLAHAQIKGMSGGGILKIIDNSISIIGIQSKVAHQMLAGGQIDFVPISYYNQIVADVNDSDRLSALYPPYLHSFEFLKDEAFILVVDEIDEENIAGARTTLRNKAEQIVNSDITPKGIKDLFEARLLIVEEETSCFSQKEIWIAWLEFLTILNIVKYDPIENAMLSEIFNNYRLKYIDGHGWREVRKDFGRSDYVGLKQDSTIFVSSKTPPTSTFILKKGKLINIAKPYDKRGFKTDDGIDPFTCFDFVHLEHFKEVCIIRKLGDYQNLSEDELLLKLKLEYHELFN
ncbi:MAG: ABC-three component system protein [Chitinophagaceae bacterium]